MKKLDKIKILSLSKDVKLSIFMASEFLDYMQKYQKDIYDVVFPQFEKYLEGGVQNEENN